jgi:hypothetical protein
MSDGSFPIYSPRRNLHPSPSKAIPNTAKGDFARNDNSNKGTTARLNETRFGPKKSRP